MSSWFRSICQAEQPSSEDGWLSFCQECWEAECSRSYWAFLDELAASLGGDGEW